MCRILPAFEHMTRASLLDAPCAVDKVEAERMRRPITHTGSVFDVLPRSLPFSPYRVVQSPDTMIDPQQVISPVKLSRAIDGPPAWLPRAHAIAEGTRCHRATRGEAHVQTVVVAIHRRLGQLRGELRQATTGQKMSLSPTSLPASRHSPRPSLPYQCLTLQQRTLSPVI